MLSPLTFLIVCPLVFLAGFVDSIAGGGGLISLPAYMMAGLPPHFAIATNKLSSAMGTTVATVKYARKGFMKWKFCISAILTAFIGSFLGAHLSLFLDENVLKIIMLILLPLIALYVFKSHSLENGEENSIPTKKTILLCAISSAIVGAYDGLYGPGTGTFLMLLFTGLCRMTLNDAAGTTKAVNLTTNLVSLSVFLLNGKVVFALGLAAGICNMIGNYIGSSCFTKKGASFVKPLILTVLAIFVVKILVELMI